MTHTQGDMMLDLILACAAIHSWEDMDDTRVCTVCERTQSRLAGDDWGPAPWVTLKPGNLAKHFSIVPQKC
jgi:hypothetical protein